MDHLRDEYMSRFYLGLEEGVDLKGRGVQCGDA